MAATVQHKASSEGKFRSDAQLPDDAARDDSSTSDRDEQKREEEEPVVAVSSPVTGGAGVVGLPRNHTDADVPANSVEDETIAPADPSIGTGEKGNTTDVENGNGEAEEQEDEEANMVFPSGVPLALLTFGLCMAT